MMRTYKQEGGNHTGKKVLKVIVGVSIGTFAFYGVGA